jgi:hypothetical protein
VNPAPLITTAKGEHIRAADLLASIAARIRQAHDNSAPARKVRAQARRLADQVDALAAELREHEQP